MSMLSDMSCINRNILECKGDPGAADWSVALVLIETYWNVKSHKPLSRPFSLFVLIETYWNVKERRASGNGCVPRINRNILECKEQS